MKRILSTILAITATAAIAQASPVLRFEENLGGIALDNACLSANEIKTIAKQSVCAADLVAVEVRDSELVYNEYRCLAGQTLSHLSYPRTTLVDVCEYYVKQEDNQVCGSFKKVPKTVQSVIKVQIENNTYGESTDISFGTVTLPDCR